MATAKKKPAAPEEIGKEAENVTEEAPLAITPDMIQQIVAQAVAAALASQKKESDEKIAELERKLEEKDAVKASTPIQVNVPGSGDVTLVYLSDSPGVINKVPNLELRCGTYGEEFTLPRAQFDQLVGLYRPWFDRGILAVSRDNIDVAAKKGLRTQDEYALKPSQLKRIGTMPIPELRKLWDSCVNDNERLCIVTYYKRKFIEGKEPGFREAERVLLMNTLTKQGLKREAIEISGASLKIGPSDFGGSY